MGHGLVRGVTGTGATCAVGGRGEGPIRPAAPTTDREAAPPAGCGYYDHEQTDSAGRTYRRQGANPAGRIYRPRGYP